MIIPLWDTCIWCWKKYWWEEVMIIKYPEWATFCLECCDRYPDYKVYDKVNEWWITTQYVPWLELTNE